MEAKHTPGPWTITDADENTTLISSKESKKPVAKIIHPHWDGEAAANAKLIKAAPDLLAALQKWNDFMTTNYHPADISWFRESLEAVAKATD